MENHEFILKCNELAAKAKERGDSPVGSVLIYNNHIIGEGIEGGKTHNDITFHAEIEAIRDAIQKNPNIDLSQSTMYTTHEPCIMCSYVIRHYKIKRIVMVNTVGNIGGYSSNYKILLDKTIDKWGEIPEIEIININTPDV